MKTPFSNFFKKVFQKETKRPDTIIHKPAEEIREEKKISIDPTPFGTISKHFHNWRPRRTHNDIKRVKNRKRNKVQHHSRVINREGK